MKYFVFVFLIFLNISIFSEEKIGVLSAIEGKVFVIRDEKQSIVQVGNSLFDDDFILTEKNASAEITLIENKGIVRVKEDSKIKMSIFKDNQKTNFSFSLIFGAVKSLVSKSPEEYFNITTSTVTTGVRGTEFEVISNELGESFVSVNDGIVTVGEISDTSDLEKEESAHLEKEIELKKDQNAEKFLDKDISMLNRKIDSAEWIKNRNEESKKHLGASIIILNKKIDILKKQITRLKKANLFIQQRRKEIKEKFKEIDARNDHIKNNRVRRNADERTYNRYKETMMRFNLHHLKIISNTRLILDKYWATREMLDLLILKIDREKIGKIKDFPQFKKRIHELKSYDKEAKVLEKQWRIMVKNIKEYRKK